jgi:hypothetical protein
VILTVCYIDDLYGHITQQLYLGGVKHRPVSILKNNLLLPVVHLKGFC